MSRLKGGALSLFVKTFFLLASAVSLNPSPSIATLLQPLQEQVDSTLAITQYMHAVEIQASSHVAFEFQVAKSIEQTCCKYVDVSCELFTDEALPVIEYLSGMFAMVPTTQPGRFGMRTYIVMY